MAAAASPRAPAAHDRLALPPLVGLGAVAAIAALLVVPIVAAGGHRRRRRPPAPPARA